MMWLVWLLACPRASAPESLPGGPVAGPATSASAGSEATGEGSEPEGPVRRPVAGGTYWAEPGGLCLEVPEAWSGTSGPAPDLLELVHPSGVQFDVRSWPSEAEVPPMEATWRMVFSDPDGYRTVPILTPASTATWQHAEQPGPTRQTWAGSVGDRFVRVEATYPFGTNVLGRDLVEPLLESLCTTYQ